MNAVEHTVRAHRFIISLVLLLLLRLCPFLLAPIYDIACVYATCIRTLHVNRRTTTIATAENLTVYFKRLSSRPLSLFRSLRRCQSIVFVS